MSVKLTSKLTSMMFFFKSSSSSANKAPPPRAKPQLSEQDRAILDLKLARDKLKKYQTALEIESATLLKRAQDCHRRKETKKALYFMKVKKLKEAKVEQLYGELLTLEQMVNSIEFTVQSVTVVAAMEKAQGALESLHRSLPLERVEELLDDVAESVAAQEEIDAALAGAGALGVGDDAALDAELAAMEVELLGEAASASATDAPPAVRLDAELPVAPNTPILPEAPTGPVEIHTAVDTAEEGGRLLVAS